MSAKEQRTYYQLQMASQEAKKASDQALRATGLTTAQTGTLLVIAAEEPVPQRVVAERLGLRESAVTAMVGRLDDLGYVTRSRDKNDARRRLLNVSAAGKAALTRSRSAFGEVNAVLEAALSPPEIIQLTELLERVADAFRTSELRRT